MLEPDPELAVAYGIFSARQARAAGHSDAQIRRNVERGRWQKSSRGVLEVEGRERQPGDHIVRELLVAGPRAVVAFAAAAWIHGWDLPALPPMPTVILPKGARPKRIRAHFANLRPGEVTLCGVVPVTAPACTAVDLAALLPVEIAVVTLDSALRSRQVSLDDLMEATGRRRIGMRSARQALLLADPLAGSVAESEARLLFHRAGLPPPVSQFAVQLGDLRARLDFAWPSHMVLVEIDGRKWHTGKEAFQLDRTKQNALVQAGWLVLRFTVEDIRLRPEYVVNELRRALCR